MLSVVTLLIVLFLSLLVTRVAAVALTLTGVPRESARFQARSAFTGVGFTTTEAELIVKHPVRRRIVMMLMLLGNLGIASVIATLILSFGGEQPEERLGHALVLLAGIVVLWLGAASQWVGARLERIIARLLRRWTDIPQRDWASLLHVRDDYGISELQVEARDWLAGKTLAEARLAEEGMVVLGIERDRTYLGAPGGATEVRAGDNLLVYGPTGRVAELDRRLRGLAGDLRHQEAVEEQAHRAQEERRDAAERS